MQLGLISVNFKNTIIQSFTYIVLVIICLLEGHIDLCHLHIYEIQRFFKISARGSVYNENRIGPRTEPWGTPNFKAHYFDFVLFISTHCCLISRYDFNIFLWITKTFSMKYSSNLSANSFSDSWSGCAFSLLLLNIESISLKRDFESFELSDIRSDRYFAWASFSSLSFVFYCALKLSLSSASFEILHFLLYFLFLFFSSSISVVIHDDLVLAFTTISFKSACLSIILKSILSYSSTMLCISDGDIGAMISRRWEATFCLNVLLLIDL